MDRHFIESYEDEREVLRKIEELKTKGSSQADMYVIARSNEQLTRIRTRTDVDYHTAEGKGMGRIGIFFRGGPLPPYFSEMAAETRESAFYYQQLVEGKILLFCNKKNEDALLDRAYSFGENEKTDITAFSPLQQKRQWNEEDRVFIDSMHYESFHPLQAEVIRNRPERKRKKEKWPGADN